MAKEKTDKDRADQFKVLANMRANRALRAIEGLSKLANKNRYKYSPEQVAKLEGAFKEALGACFAAFKTGSAPVTGTDIL